MVKPQPPGALHFVTGNYINRLPVFTEPECCKAFLEQLKKLNEEWPAKLIAYVLMPDHFHFISNPQDGCIIEFCRDLKSKAAKAIVKASRRWSSSRSFYCQGDEPLAVDHDWWWPNDAEKLSKAMKKMGWHSYWVRDNDK